MTIQEMLLWAREWNRMHRSSPKYRGAAKYRRMTIDKVQRLQKKEIQNAG